MKILCVIMTIIALLSSAPINCVQLFPSLMKNHQPKNKQVYSINAPSPKNDTSAAVQNRQMCIADLKKLTDQTDKKASINLLLSQLTQAHEHAIDTFYMNLKNGKASNNLDIVKVTDNNTLEILMHLYCLDVHHTLLNESQKNVIMVELMYLQYQKIGKPQNPDHDLIKTLFPKVYALALLEYVISPSRS